jgi:hypothetical protein
MAFGKLAERERERERNIGSNLLPYPSLVNGGRGPEGGTASERHPQAAAGGHGAALVRHRDALDGPEQCDVVDGVVVEARQLIL